MAGPAGLQLGQPAHRVLRQAQRGRIHLGGHRRPFRVVPGLSSRSMGSGVSGRGGGASALIGAIAVPQRNASAQVVVCVLAAVRAPGLEDVQLHVLQHDGVPAALRGVLGERRRAPLDGPRCTSFVEPTISWLTHELCCIRWVQSSWRITAPTPCTRSTGTHPARISFAKSWPDRSEVNGFFGCFGRRRPGPPYRSP